MKKIEKFVARDGSEYFTLEDATAKEYLLDEVDAIYAIFPKHPDTADFVNGHGYIQHDGSKIVWARNMLIDLAKRYVFSEIDTHNIRSYAFGRYLNDNNSILYGVYNRIVSCVDDNTWREYGQPYFANHPNEADEVQVNA